MQRTSFLVSISLFLLLSGCRNRDSIETYRVSKEVQPAMPLTAESNAATTKDIEWDVPSGWQEQAPSAMRLGSFLIQGANGQTAEVSVIPLSGAAGGDLANINRWRGQINLDPLPEAGLLPNSQTIEAGGRTMRWVDFVSRDPLINNRYKKRLIAAIYTHGDTTWFFKLMGEDQTVETAKPAFLHFLRSLRFHGRA